jgi:hypothetical protein
MVRVGHQKGISISHSVDGAMATALHARDSPSLFAERARLPQQYLVPAKLSPPSRHKIVRKMRVRAAQLGYMRDRGPGHAAPFVRSKLILHIGLRELLERRAPADPYRRIVYYGRCSSLDGLKFHRSVSPGLPLLRCSLIDLSCLIRVTSSTHLLPFELQKKSKKIVKKSNFIIYKLCNLF